MNKLTKIVAMLFFVAFGFLAILARIRLAEGGDYFSEKRMLVSAIIIFAVLVLFLLIHIIEVITKTRK
jgi:hypothetical protein